MKEIFFSKSYEEIEKILIELNFNPKLTSALFDKYYKFKKIKLEQIPPHFFELIESKLDFNLPKIANIQTAEDQTTKFLIQFDDGLQVETVLIPFHKKFSICLSSQVGCAMNCSFCYTGTQGLKRNLKAHEIVMQYLVAYDFAIKHFPSPVPSPNIVFMGQGEPFHNFDEVKKAVSLFQERSGLNLGPRQMTISSAGFIPGIKRINELKNINLAISFHSPFNEVRDILIPLNKKYPIEELMQELKNVPLMKRQYITFEYLLIDELNNHLKDAEYLSERLKDIPAIINLIPFNPFPGSTFKRPSSKQVEEFKSFLVSKGLRTMIRTTKGDEILAACGQLNTKLAENNKLPLDLKA